MENLVQNLTCFSGTSVIPLLALDHSTTAQAKSVDFLVRFYSSKGQAESFRRALLPQRRQRLEHSRSRLGKDGVPHANRMALKVSARTNISRAKHRE